MQASYLKTKYYKILLRHSIVPHWSTRFTTFSERFDQEIIQFKSNNIYYRINEHVKFMSSIHIKIMIIEIIIKYTY